MNTINYFVLFQTLLTFLSFAAGKDEWLEFKIPEFTMNGSAFDVAEALEAAILESDGKKSGFIRVQIDPKVALNEITAETFLKDAPVRVLLNVLSDRVNANWFNYSGFVVIVPIEPDLGMGLNMDKHLLELFDIEHTVDQRLNLDKLHSKLIEMGSQLERSDLTIVIDRGDSASISIVSYPQEIKYLESVIEVLSRRYVISERSPD